LIDLFFLETSMRIAIVFVPLLLTGSICGSEKSDPNDVRDAVSKALVLLERGSAGSAQERQCFTCHSQAMPVLAFAEARRRGLRVNEENFTAQVAHTQRFLKRSQANFDKGKGVGGQVDTAGYALWTLEDGNIPASDVTDSVVTWLLDRQTERGNWKTSSKRPPSESSNFTATYIALRAIEVFGNAEQRPEVERAYTLAAAWLHDSNPKNTEDRVFRLLSLNRVEDATDLVQPIINQLKTSQREDGGWSQTDEMESDAYATGTVLYSLHHAGVSTDRPVYRRGIQYLLNSQLDDGSWHVVSRSKPFQTYFETGFPHKKDQFISTTATAWATLALLYTLPEGKAEPAAIQIGSRRELFVDKLLIDRLEGSAKLQLQQPIPGEVVLTTDKPWEGNTSAYFTMFTDVDANDEQIFRMYYRGSHYDEETKKGTHPEVTCYAESKDGVNWIKPELGLYSFDGSKKNNIVWDGLGTHCFTPFKDGNPNCESDARYKAISRGRPTHPAGLYAFKSPDGIHWSVISDKPIITEGAFDSQNLAFWDDYSGCYRAYHRNFRNGVRGIMTETSDDFVTWTKPEYIRLPDAPNEHLYTNAIRRYSRAPHLLLGFPTRYLPQEGQRVEPTFMSSRDGITFHRWIDPIIPEDAPQDRKGNRSNYMTNALFTLPTPNNSDTDAPRELSVYGTEAYYTGPDSRVRRFMYRTDGFVALHADESGGAMISRPIEFTGDTLSLNYRTADSGYVVVKLLGSDGKPIVESQQLQGDETHRRINLDRGQVLGAAGQPVRIRIELKNADVFSYQFQLAK
jgi:hypothetical protein